MEKLSIIQELRENAYPGRGIVIGKSLDGRSAVMLLRQRPDVPLVFPFIS